MEKIEMVIGFVAHTDPYILGGVATLLFLILPMFFRTKKLEASYRDMVDPDLPHEVREMISKIREKHPECCRTCHGTATNPLFLTGDCEEEECPDCYAIGVDPYDTDLQLVKSGQYMVSSLYGVDPLYRGYSLPGGKLLALTEELEDDE